jgi:hypothetical protein
MSATTGGMGRRGVRVAVGVAGGSVMAGETDASDVAETTALGAAPCWLQALRIIAARTDARAALM